MKTLIPILSLLLLTTACAPKPENQPADQAPQVQPEQPTAAENATADAPKAPEAEHHAGMVHDPSNPPIDCPLREQGIDPTQMKPFEQIEAYIQFLDREDRKIWQKPEEVVDAMQLKGNERVLDLGAGSGYFSFPISKKSHPDASSRRMLSLK